MLYPSVQNRMNVSNELDPNTSSVYKLHLGGTGSSLGADAEIL